MKTLPLNEFSPGSTDWHLAYKDHEIKLLASRIVHIQAINAELLAALEGLRRCVHVQADDTLISRAPSFSAIEKADTVIAKSEREV